MSKIEENHADGLTSDRLELFVKLLRLSSVITTPLKEAVCDPTGIAAIEARAMMPLAAEGVLAGHDLVEMTGMPAMSASRAIAMLRSRGWVEPVVDPVSRRRRPVALTPEGWSAYIDIERAHAALADDVLGVLDARERRAFAASADLVTGRLANWPSRS